MSSETMAIRGLEIQLNRAYDEIARLRAVLEEIIEIDKYGYGDLGHIPNAADLAREALMLVHPKDDVEQRPKLPPDQGQPRHNNKDQ